MGVHVHHMIMYGYKLPYLKVKEEYDDEVHEEYSMYNDYDPDKIVILFDNYGCKYTIIGFIIDAANSEDSFEGFNDPTSFVTFNRKAKLWRFIQEVDFFEDLMTEHIGDPKIMAFTHCT